MHSFVVGAGAFDVVQVQGPDAARFLQGQLTCDVNTLADNSRVYGACCNNKGRVIAAFVLVRVADIYYLCMPRGLGEVLVTALRKYVPFYRCDLMLAADSHQLLAIAGSDQIAHFAGVAALEAGQAVLRTSGWLCNLEAEPARALWWCSVGQAMPNDATTAGSLEQWETLALLDGHYPFRQNDSGLFTPQELNFDLNGYVSFSKGCYTGQEIVARMHYRGKPKKQLFLAKLAQPATFAEGDTLLPVTDTQNHTLGSCRLQRSCGNLHLALIEMPADFSGNSGELKIADSLITASCAFEPKVIQFSHFVSA